ncbi:uncharacterized protein LOC121995428 [Zingiber officinale]|uniref:Neprosin PEP catalytic domain-containing protein n=1 Tax=Zingiber officinale TaxID=94328 RepID=A0A8J5GEJ7_ZINOF|nr:uncharacterized protein LOC121995428 [Zingiber officinale]KAG6502039.1 hypothetical protein ZIOFF_041926 [Zingiber officinale]
MAFNQRFTMWSLPIVGPDRASANQLWTMGDIDGGPGRNIPLTEEEDLEIEKELQSLNKPPVKTLKSFTGDLFDCIEMYKQPAFDNPVLKNHKLQIRPSFQTKSNVTMDEKFKPPIDPGFNDTCPLGTVIIRRTRKEELIMAKELPKYFRNYDSRYGVLDSSGNNYYVAMQSQKSKFHGFESSITTWALPNVGPDQSTANQVWMIGDVDGPEENLNAIQTGWHVFPQLYNDTLTRFFTYFTIDSHKTGCINLLCKGFVQVSAIHGPGYAFTGSGLSTYGGKQSYFSFEIRKDPELGHWWLSTADENLGYWPKEILPSLDVAKQIDFGGVVYSPNNEGSPPMGSGYFAEEGIGKSSYFKSVTFRGDDQRAFTPGKDWARAVQNVAEKYYQIIAPIPDGGPWNVAYGGPGGLFNSSVV